MLQTTKIDCIVFDKNTSDRFKYNKPIYTKLDSMYGYLSVSGMVVYFFWFNHDSNNVCCDDVSDRFTVKYKMSL